MCRSTGTSHQRAASQCVPDPTCRRSEGRQIARLAPVRRPEAQLTRRRAIRRLGPDGEVVDGDGAFVTVRARQVFDHNVTDATPKAATRTLINGHVDPPG